VVLGQFGQQIGLDYFNSNPCTFARFEQDVNKRTLYREEPIERTIKSPSLLSKVKLLPLTFLPLSQTGYVKHTFLSGVHVSFELLTSKNG
jgi:hypothetical protein